MDKIDYEKLKTEFKTLTGKNADDSFEAHMSYLVLISISDMKFIMAGISNELNKIIGKT